MLVSQRLTKSFGRLRALGDVSVAMERGQSVWLSGPNGSGKTTFIQCVLGLLLPDKGELTLGGQSLLGNPAARRNLGYMPQIGRFPDHLKVGQILDEITSDVLYLIDGRVPFYRPIAEFFDAHGALKLGRVIAKIMRESADG